MATFNELKKRSAALAKAVSNETGVRLKVVANVIVYAKQLCPPDQPDLIDENIFVAQMGLRFGITSRYHVQLMFESRRIKKVSGKLMLVEDYIRLICIFLSKKLDLKINYVFSVYDFKQDGMLDVGEISALLRTSIIHSGDDNDPADALHDLITLLLSVTDTNNDGVISLEEFRAFVKHDILCIQMLGTVLPNEHILEKFYTMMSILAPQVIRERFNDERNKCLEEPTAALVSDRDTLYPGVQLDLT